MGTVHTQQRGEEVNAAEKAMQDITALLEQHYSGEVAMTEVDVVMAVNRIVGRYDMERIGETK